MMWSVINVSSAVGFPSSRRVSGQEIDAGIGPSCRLSLEPVWQAAVATPTEAGCDSARATAGTASTLTDWHGRTRHDLVHALSEVLLERAIGVVYRPQTELTSHYFEAVLADQFDAWVWFEETRAVIPLGHEQPHGAPETWPFGL